jgi:hypothetical protein
LLALPAIATVVLSGIRIPLAMVRRPPNHARSDARYVALENSARAT